MDILDAIGRVLLAAVLLVPTQASARDIVSTFPSGTEVLRALGLGGRLAGVSRFCRENGDLPTVGSAVAPDLEAIARLRPRWLVVPDMFGNQKLLHFARTFRIRTLVLGIDRLDDLDESVRRAGRAFGRGQRARAIIEEMAALPSSSWIGPGERVLVVVGARRRGRFFTGITAASGATFYGDIVSRMGGIPLSLGPGRYPSISPEAFARMPIDRLVFVTARSLPGDADRWRALNLAIGNIHVLEGIDYFVPGPGIVSRFARLGEGP